jgi:hypothetical protein
MLEQTTTGPATMLLVWKAITLLLLYLSAADIGDLHIDLPEGGQSLNNEH